jgi:hypothetical protein
MHGRWPRRAGWARIGERIGVRRSSGGSAPSIAVRAALVGTRTRYISVVRSLLRREGIGVRSGGSSSFVARVGELLLPQWLESEIAPLLAVMEKLNEEIPCCRRSARQASEDGCGGSSSVHGARRGGCDGDRVPSDAGRGRAFSRRASGGVVPRAGTAGDELGGKATPRPDHEVGQRPSAMAAGRSAWAVWRSRTVETAVLRAWAQRIAAREARCHGRPSRLAGSCLRCGGTRPPLSRGRSEHSRRGRPDSSRLRRTRRKERAAARRRKTQ